MSPTTNFLGIPIEGDINRPRPGVTQRPREDFEPLVRALLDDDLIADFGWHQYTPYFNDGDPCVFGANGFWVRTVNDTADDDDDPEEDFSVQYSTHPTLGGLEGGWNEDRRYVGNHERQWRAANELARAIDAGEFDAVLLDLFGDHAKVTVTRGGITVDEYSHD